MFSKRIPSLVLAVVFQAVACGSPSSTPAADAGSQDAGIVADAGTNPSPDSGVDAGVEVPPDAGIDAGIEASADAGTDAGVEVVPDAGVDGGVDAGIVVILDAGIDAGIDAGTTPDMDAGTDGGSIVADAGTDGGSIILDAGTDGGSIVVDAGTDGGSIVVDAGTDGGSIILDAGTDGGSIILDAGTDGGSIVVDAGSNSDAGSVIDAGPADAGAPGSIGDACINTNSGQLEQSTCLPGLLCLPLSSENTALTVCTQVCTQNADCGGGNICWSGICWQGCAAPGAGCIQSDFSCQPFSDTANICLPNCGTQASSFCTEFYGYPYNVCDASTGTCQTAGDSCNAPSDCTPGQACFPLSETNPSATSSVCVEDCIQATAQPCMQPTDCVSDSCTNGVCDACPGGMICNANTRACAAVTVDVYGECSRNSQCPAGVNCIQFGAGFGLCLPGCTIDADCPASDSGTAGCVFPLNDGSSVCGIDCTASGTCPTNEACTNFGIGSFCAPSPGAGGGAVGAHCTPTGGSLQQDDCASSLLCLPLSDLSPDLTVCTAACSSDSDCGSGNICWSGVCWESCSTSNPCSQSDFSCQDYDGTRRICIPDCSQQPRSFCGDFFGYPWVTCDATVGSSQLGACTSAGNSCDAILTCATGQACWTEPNDRYSTCVNDCTLNPLPACSNDSECQSGFCRNGHCAACAATSVCDAASTHTCQSGAACTDACSAGATRCSGNEVMTCGLTPDACLGWITTSCSNGQICSPQGCVDDPCGGIPQNGACTSSTSVAWCVFPTDGNGPPTVVSQACLGGESCVISGGIADCVQTGACVDGQSQCSGANTLQECVNGAWRNTTCPGTCSSTLFGSFCPPAVATKVVNGTVNYEALVPNADLSDWDSTVYTAPFQYALILSYSGNNLLDATTADGQGRFSITVPSSPTGNDYVYAVAASLDSSGAILYALADPDLPSDSTQAAGEVGTDTNAWSWSWPASTISDGEVLNITQAMGAGAAYEFVWLDAIYWDVQQHYGSEGKSVVGWLGYGVNWDCGACFLSAPTNALNSSFDSQIFFGGGDDQEYWATSVTAHELGHWAMDSYGTSPDEGGTHYVGTPTFPGQAWSEGWATYFSSQEREDPVYVDKQDGAMFWFDISTRDYPFALWERPVAANGLLQKMDENEVAAMLWNIRTQNSSDTSPIMEALASSRMNTSPWARGNTRHTWDLDASNNFINVVDTGQSRPCVADFLDALTCGGLSRSMIDAATEPTTHYPYPSRNPICQ